MKNKKASLSRLIGRTATALFGIILFISCASVPPSTVALSEQLGKDLQVVQTSHIKAIEIHYNDIKNNINSFIDNTYAPFIINYVLKKEYSSFQQAKPSIFGALKDAAEYNNKDTTELAVQEMQSFLAAANRQIQKKRQSLLDPVTEQEQKIKDAIHASYSNMINANNSVTNYLKSIQDLKKTQSEALSLIGLAGSDTLVTQNLSNLSNSINKLVNEGNQIDVKSETALKDIENISDKIKSLINKK